MKILSESGRIRPSALFKPVAVSFFIAYGLLVCVGLLPTFLITPQAGSPDFPLWGFFLILPLVSLLLSFMVGGVVVFGAWLYSRFRTIEVVAIEMVDGGPPKL